MSLTNDELEQRILVIEQKLNEMQEAINNMAPKRMVKALSVVQQQPTETAVETRLVALETKDNQMQVALNNCPTKLQLNALSSIRQQEIDELKQKVTDLETQVALLQSAQ
jgi:hypothetical protein